MDESVVVGLPGWVGRRVVVRHRLPDGSATDALGTLVDVDVAEGTCTVHRDATDADVVVPLVAVLLAKPVPPRPPARAARRGGPDASGQGVAGGAGSGPQMMRSPEE